MFGINDKAKGNEDGIFPVVTKDGKASAHFEHTVLATDDEPILLTTLMD